VSIFVHIGNKASNIQFCFTNSPKNRNFFGDYGSQYFYFMPNILGHKSSSRQLFSRKDPFLAEYILVKIAKIWDHNIGPWSQPYDRELQRQRCKNLQRHE
jgi:hypothetical protein